jgi:hypothetical protein
MPYDDAPPSADDLSADLTAGNYSTAPPAGQASGTGAASGPATWSGYTQDPRNSSVWRNADGSIGYLGQPSTVSHDPVNGLTLSINGSSNPDSIAEFVKAHPDMEAAPQQQPAGQAPPADSLVASTGSGPGDAPALSSDDVGSLLAKGYSTAPGGPTVGYGPATPQPTPDQQAAQDWVAKRDQDSSLPGPVEQGFERPMQTFLHAATLGASDALPSAMVWGATAIKNAAMRLQGQTPPFSASDAYSAQHQSLLDEESQFRQDHPSADLGLTVAGAVATPFPAAGFVAKGLKAAPLIAKLPIIGGTLARALGSSSIAARMARAAPVGGAMGATAGLMDANSADQVAPSMASGAGLGAVGGVGGEALGAGLAKGVNAVAKKFIPQKVTPVLLAQAQAHLRSMGVDGLPSTGQQSLEAMLGKGAHPADAATTAAASSLPNPVRLSRGQMSGEAAQQWQETQALKGARGPGAEMVSKGFRSDQQQTLRQNLQDIASRIGGGRAIDPGQGGAMASDALNSSRDVQHAAMKAAYGAAESAKNPAVLHSYDASAAVGAVKQAIGNYDPLRIPAVARELDRLEDMSANKQGMDARDLFQVRARLTALRASNDGVEASAAGHAVKALDAEIHTAVSDGLLTGDPATVDLWRKAIGERREFGQLFQGGDLVERLTAREPRSGRMQLAVDPHDASNVILGRSALGFVGRKNLYRDLNTMKDRLGASSPAWNGIRGEVFQRLANTAARTVDGSAQFDGERFQTIWREFKKDDPQLLSSLYSGDEQSLIDRFAGVAAKVTRNPSAAGVGGVAGSMHQILKRLPFATLETIPLIGHMADKVDAFIGQRAAVRDTVRAMPRLAPSTTPAASLAVQGASGAQALRRR